MSAPLRLLTRRAGGLGLVTLGVLTCSATQRAQLRDDEGAAAPVLSLRSERLASAELGDDERDCAQPVPVRHGGVPPGATPLWRLHLTASAAHPLALFEQALQERAATYCADGLSILRAEAGAGESGVRAVVAVAWRMTPRVTGAPRSDSMAPDGGASDFSEFESEQEEGD